MFESVEFHNFKVLRHATLPLKPFTLIVGPNGSGKSTALQGLQAMRAPRDVAFDAIVSAGDNANPPPVEVTVSWSAPYSGLLTIAKWFKPGGSQGPQWIGRGLVGHEARLLQTRLTKIRLFSLSADAIAAPVELQPNTESKTDGGNLAGVLDRLRDQHPDRFDALNDTLGQWLPEFNRVLFDTPAPGSRAFMLRTKEGGHPLPASSLSQGTLLALAILTLAYLPEPPPLVCLEEPDRGIHPRLLRDVRDALYRLSYPHTFGEDREPVQVIATTHSPYFLDLFKDHPEEVVIAHKQGQEATFTRLTDLPNYQEILEDSHLGDAWYSGVLGGVPCER